MAKDAEPPKPSPSEREAKLAQALRANLRRRKAGAPQMPGRGGPPKDQGRD